ncbi:MAG: 23S rRNA (cytosine(1962)-C(5))-methyltransferase RlmI, partial [Acidimicrobiia bacterium]|nr:23S rRNA (cytosine(1962)-C(5))-methyltransferase RlmI [Acidimicrobiia bacterium]
MPSRTSRAPTLVVPAGRDKALARHHPWIFPGAVAQLHGEAAAGDTVVVRSAAGKFLAHASWHPDAHIRARVWSFDEADTIDDAFFARRIARAAERRRALAPATDACRLVFGESDG